MLSTLNVKDVFSGNGVVRDWTYSFQILTSDGSDIQLWLTSPTGVVSQITTSYSINVTNKVVTYPTIASLMDPIATGYTLELRRVTPKTQAIDIVPGGNLDANALEGALDKATAICQELKSQLTDIVVTGTTPAQVAILLSELNTLVALATVYEASALASKNASAISAAAALISETNAAISAAQALAAVPTIGAGDAYKVIQVKSDHSGYELTAGNTANRPVILDSLGKLPAVDGSALTGISSANVQVFSSDGTWTKPAGATIVEVHCVGAGGGGGGGGTYASSTNSGACGGGGGAKTVKIFRASDLTATVAVTIGAGGDGGAGGNPTGSAGVDGGNTTFGSYLTAYGGGGGGGSSHAQTNGTGGGGGGSAGKGATGAGNTTTKSGGLPAITAGLNGLSGQGAGCDCSADGKCAEWGGGCGGGIDGTARKGGSSLYGGGGGGVGSFYGGSGWVDTSSEGGASGSYVAGGGGAGSTVGGGVGGNGTDGDGVLTCGAGGGGSGSKAGVTGGKGGAWGGGGGGGSITAGTGGAGGKGGCVVYSW